MLRILIIKSTFTGYVCLLIIYRCQLFIKLLLNFLDNYVPVHVPGRGIQSHLYCDHIGQSQLPLLSFLLMSSKVTWHLKTTVLLKGEPTSRGPVFTVRPEGCKQTTWTSKLYDFPSSAKLGLLWAWRVFVPLSKYRNTLCPRVIGKGQDKKWLVWEQPLTGTCLLILWDPTQRLFSHEVWPPSLLWS